MDRAKKADGVTGPLSGVRVIELAHIMAGPVCGLMLSDMGADVIKVERLPRGDGTRGFLPPEVEGESAAFMMLNRGKRSVALDLRSKEGVEIVRRLLSEADVVIENFRVGTMEKIGLGWSGLSELNPKLVYCQITGFGRTGPMSQKGGFDLIAQGYSGLMSVTGEGDGREPVKVGTPVTDVTAGILAAFGVVSALFERERSGEGQLVDTSLFEAGITQTYWQSAIALASGLSPGPLGSAHPLAAPYQAFRTADGWINVGASNDPTWHGLTRALGMQGLATDPRFKDNASRMKHLDQLTEVLGLILATEMTETWLDRLAHEGVPAGPIASIGEMLENPQTIARAMVVETEHPKAGRVRSLGNAVKMWGRGAASIGESDAPTIPEARLGPAPMLGEHTCAVLLDAGWTERDLERLHNAGVLVSSDPKMVL